MLAPCQKEFSWLVLSETLQPYLSHPAAQNCSIIRTLPNHRELKMSRVILITGANRGEKYRSGIECLGFDWVHRHWQRLRGTLSCPGRHNRHWNRPGNLIREREKPQYTAKGERLSSDCRPAQRRQPIERHRSRIRDPDAAQDRAHRRRHRECRDLQPLGPSTGDG